MRRFYCCTLPTLVSSCLLWYPVQASATTQADSLRLIPEVTIESDIRYHETILPQQLKGEALQQLNAHSVADALRHLSGLQLKDYGGLGGIKTINIRSMGSHHVGIYYDGIELGNAQNGQIDLGQLSLDNIEEISVYNGQRSAILQTASDFANAGSVYIKTAVPGSNPRRIIKLQGGSSNLGRLSFLSEQKISDHLSLSLNAEALSSNGKYDFRYRRLNYDGSVAYDTTAVRQNGDIQALRAEVNLFGQGQDHKHETHWSAKAYTYHSTRGIPGAIVNNVWRRGERQGDDNTFLQGMWQREFTPRYTARIAAKYAYYATHYLNRDTTQLLIDHHYRQQELYVTTTHVFSHSDHWSTSASYDLRWNDLSSDAARFAFPTRLSQLLSLATAIDTRHWQAQASAVFTHVDDWVRVGNAQKDINQWTPAFFLSYTPLSNRRRLQMRAFAKKSFRMPTFNDLYYTDMGNALLRPESALQYSIGAEGNHACGNWLQFFWSADIYHNSVHDKIVAYPKGQQFRWTMLNLGRVHINGVDLRTETAAQLLPNITTGVRLQYTYQDARDVTDPETSFYNDQIPYIPWHSGSASFWAQWQAFSMSYNFIYTGERYSQSENILYNHLQPWYTSDVAVSWEGGKGLGSWKGLRGLKGLKVTLEINNLLDQQYDVIINYPMPGRSYLFSMQWTIY